MSFFIEIAIFSLLMVLIIMLLFIVIRVSTKTNDKVVLLETLVEQQDYQIELLRKVCSSLGADLTDPTPSTFADVEDTPMTKERGMNFFKGKNTVKTAQEPRSHSKEDISEFEEIVPPAEEIPGIKIFAER